MCSFLFHLSLVRIKKKKASFFECLTIEHYMVKSSQFIVKIHMQTNFLNLMAAYTYFCLRITVNFSSLLSLLTSL